MVITITEYGQNQVKLLYFNSFVAIKILLRHDYINKDSHAFMPLPIRSLG